MHAWIRRSVSALVILFVGGAAPGVAFADSAHDIALQAQAFERQYCDVSGAGTTAAAKALREVIPVFERLSEIYESGDARFLLYWRGVLEQCIGQTDRAIDDFRGFLRDTRAADTYKTLADEAARRLKVLGDVTKRSARAAKAAPRRDLNAFDRGQAQKAALRAHEVNEQYCAAVAADKASDAAKALKSVLPAYEQISAIYDGTGAPFLLYWRAVLGQCIGLKARAAADLGSFLSDKQNFKEFASLATDAAVRMRRMGVPLPAVARRTLSPAVTKLRRVILGVGGGYALIVAEGSPFHYVGLSVDLSVLIAGPLRVEVLVRPALSAPNRFESGSVPDPATLAKDQPRRSLLLLAGVGPLLRFDGPVHPRLGMVLQIAPNGPAAEGGPLLLGAAGTFGVDIPLGDSALALRPALEVGFLARFFTFRGGLELGVGF